MEKLNIRIEYDKDVGISIDDIIKYLNGLETSYTRFTNKKSKLSIQKVTEGSIEITLIEHVIVPVFAAVVSNGVYDFGKHIISCLQLAKFEFDELIRRYKKKDKEACEAVQTTGDVTGNYNSFNLVHISINKDGEKSETDTTNKDDLSKIYNNILPLLENKDKERNFERYDSVELKFRTVSKLDSGGSYSGYINSLDKNPKKITFNSNDLKTEFDFTNSPFEKSYIVSVNVKLNANNSIGSYEIIEFHCILDNDI